MELELYALVYCIKQLSHYLLGRLFTVRTDHRNLLYLANSTVSKLVRWRVLLSEYNFTVEHIPGKANVVADGLTRVNSPVYNHFPVPKQSLYVDDTLYRIFRLEGKDGEPEEFKEDVIDDEVMDPDDPNVPQIGPIERFGTFKKYHNSSVGHFGIGRTMEAMRR
jgi:RNase H-like domain found in reverse transcriptase